LEKSYPLLTTNNTTGDLRLNLNLPKEILKAPGPSYQTIIAEENKSLRDDERRMAEAQRVLNVQTTEEERQAQEVRTYKQKTEKIGAEYIALQEEQINKDPPGDVREDRKKLIEAEKQLKLLQTVIEKEEESLESDRLKREIVDKEAEVAVLKKD